MNKDARKRIEALYSCMPDDPLFHPVGAWDFSSPKTFNEVQPIWEGTRGDENLAADLDILKRFIKPEYEPLRVLEVGGGYGRLATAICKAYNVSQYDMIDAVPESIVHAQDNTKWPVRVFPSWNYTQEPQRLNLLINIASFQEMTLSQVAYYIDMFDYCACPGAIIFLANSRDDFGIFPSYPPLWRLLHMANYPRSRTPFFPAEVYEKCAHGLGDLNGSTLRLQYYESIIPQYSNCWRNLRDTLRENNRLRLQVKHLTTNRSYLRKLVDLIAHK